MRRRSSAIIIVSKNPKPLPINEHFHLFSFAHPDHGNEWLCRPSFIQAIQAHGPADVAGTSRGAPSSSEWPAGVKHLRVDFLDPDRTRSMLEEFRPSQIYHLAGQASVARSWEAPAETYLANIQGQLNLFEAILRLAMRPKILIVCSSDEYGAVEPTELPVRETNPLSPLSPYAISKVAQDLMGFQYFRSSKLPIVRTRAFNHTGPGRPNTYAVSSFASQIARIESGLQPPVLHVGGFDDSKRLPGCAGRRPSVYPGDHQGIPGEVYNICAGRSYRLQELVDFMLARSSVKIRITQDPDKIRPADFPVICGDPTKFQRLTGWKPLIPIEQTVADSLDHWRRVWTQTAVISPTLAPRFSVVMAVQNGHPYLKTAVESVLSQSFIDFEFIIVDDHSTDGTLDYLRNLTDPRLRIIQALKHGQTPGLNQGIRHARADWIVRMDGDDWCYSQRLAKLWSAIEQSPGTVLITSDYELCDENLRPVAPIRLRQDASAVLGYLRSKNNPFCHPTVMFHRTSADPWAILMKACAMLKTTGFGCACSSMEDGPMYQICFCATACVAVLFPFCASRNRRMSGCPFFKAHHPWSVRNLHPTRSLPQRQLKECTAIDWHSEHGSRRNAAIAGVMP